MPHGVGHHDEATRVRVARRKPCVNSNMLTDETSLDRLSGTVEMNAIRVQVHSLPARSSRVARAVRLA